MDPALWTAILGLAGSAMGALAGVFLNTKLSNYRIEQLEKKVEEHNRIVDRTYVLEAEVKKINGDIEHIYHEIDDIKND